MKKRLMAILLSVMMVLTMLPTTVFAADLYKLTMTDQSGVDGIQNTSMRIGSDYYWNGNSIDVSEGTRVLLGCVIDEGYLFRNWTAEPSEPANFLNIRDTYFDMPSSDITFTANVEEI